jgi:hypothetical protein
MNKGTKGVLFASAVATLFLATAAMAQEPGAAASSGGQMQGATVKCVGANSCKGHGSCKIAQNDCKGQNACKGKGFVNTASTDECSQQGGHPES